MIRLVGIRKTHISLLFMLLLVLIVLVSDLFILTESVFYEYFKDQLTYQQITEVLQFKSRWWFLDLLIAPTIYILKFFLLSMWLITGMTLVGYRTSFAEVFNACVLAEFVQLIPSFLGLIWFGFLNDNYSLQDVQNFHPFSLLSLFEMDEVAQWMRYPLQSLGLFQVAYVLLLAYGLKDSIGKTYKASLMVTLPIYISGICIWLVFVVFLTINYSL